MQPFMVEMIKTIILHYKISNNMNILLSQSLRKWNNNLISQWERKRELVPVRSKNPKLQIKKNCPWRNGL